MNSIGPASVVVPSLAVRIQPDPITLNPRNGRKSVTSSSAARAEAGTSGAIPPSELADSTMM